MAVFVVQVKTGRELLAATMLELHLGLAVYLPQVMQRRYGRSGLAPLFPGYLFVTSDPAHFVRSAVDGQPGVVHVVSVGATPCVVDEAVLAALQARVEVVNAAGGLPVHPFKQMCIRDRARRQRRAPAVSAPRNGAESPRARSASSARQRSPPFLPAAHSAAAPRPQA